LERRQPGQRWAELKIRSVTTGASVECYVVGRSSRCKHLFGSACTIRMPLAIVEPLTALSDEGCPVVLQHQASQSSRGECSRIDIDPITNRRMPMDNDLSVVFFAVKKILPYRDKVLLLLRI
jgi:hypothetical protein